MENKKSMAYYRQEKDGVPQGDGGPERQMVSDGERERARADLWTPSTKGGGY